MDFPARAVVAWLSTLAPQLMRGGDCAAGQAAVSWLRVLRALRRTSPQSGGPHALESIAATCTRKLTPACAAAPAVLPVIEELAAAVTDLEQPHGVTGPIALTLVHALREALVAALENARARRARQGSHAAYKEQEAAWDTAQRLFTAMSGLAVHAAARSAFAGADLDGVLLAALLCTPRARALLDEGAPISRGAARVVALLQQRMRWLGAVQLFSIPEGCRLEAKRFELLALMRALRNGHSENPRCELAYFGCTAVLPAMQAV